jgi:hypothetical protein
VPANGDKSNCTVELKENELNIKTVPPKIRKGRASKKEIKKLDTHDEFESDFSQVF